MSTLVTRSIGGVDRFDRQAVRVDALTYKELSGVFVITVASYVATGAGGEVDVRVPNYQAANDVAIVDKATVANGSSVTVNKKVVVAVNNGVVGPSARVNSDGTWDLLDLTYTLALDNELTDRSVTLTYTLAWTDLTPSTTNPSSGNSDLVLNVGDGQTSETGVIGVADGTLSTNDGYIKAWINQITTSLIPVVGGINAVFSVAMANGDCGCSGVPDNVLIQHLVSQVSGTKIYTQAMVVFAVNYGQIDGNGAHINGTNGQGVGLRCKLESTLDEIDLTLTYNVGFTSV